MKKLICICMVTLMTLSTLVGCVAESTVSSDNAVVFQRTRWL